ncbi:MAG: U32 family peptidase [Clostridia bacterium]|nr:U32 family peptidase [Clostridia bacterium]
MELLSPAGDLKSFYAAVYNGADAIYLGLKSFNARIKADNFTNDNIADIVSFAHIYGVKVYVTINTLIKDGEVEEFLDTVRACIAANVDAYIIQDFGMANYLRNKFKGINLHASTQMGIHNLAGARVLQELGFSRVVLSRETKLEDIRDIRDNTDLEIEYFVQGALCVAFSGNCYLSAIKNGNSGNRGKCLQLCRLPYKVYDNDKIISEGYYLSPKDLSLMDKLAELRDAGVTSLKIEGRLKRASYVAQVTRSYRKALKFLEEDKEFSCDKERAKIAELFSRGKFNDSAYLYDNFDIINPKINNHEGKNIGKVIGVEKFKDIFKITLKLTEQIGQGDAIRLVKDSIIQSIGVGNVNILNNNCYEIFSTQKAIVGASVYLLKSEAKESNLTSFVRPLPINMHFSGFVGNKAILSASLGAMQVCVQSEKTLEAAKTSGVTYDTIYKQVSKLNDTKFRLEILEVEADNCFIAVSELNDLRRRVIAELEAEALKLYNLNLRKIEETDYQIDTIINTNKDNYYIISSHTDLKDIDTSYGVILCPNSYDMNLKFEIIDICKKGISKDAIYLNLPIVSTGVELQNLQELVASLGVGVVANNYSHFCFVKDYPAIAGMGLNVYNKYTAKYLLDYGFDNFVWSIERENIEESGLTLVSGHPALMTFCHCPFREIIGGNCGNCKYTNGLIYEDEKNNRYRLRRYKLINCYFELYSEEVLNKATKAGKILDIRKV